MRAHKDTRTRGWEQGVFAQFALTVRENVTVCVGVCKRFFMHQGGAVGPAERKGIISGPYSTKYIE